MKYNVGDKVRVKSIDWYNQNKDSRKRVALKNGYYFTKEMTRFCDAILTIEGVCESQNFSHYLMKEDGHVWTDDMIEGLAEFIHHITLYPEGIHVADGYEFQDENGNTINARKLKVVKMNPKYPATYEECYRILDMSREYHTNIGYKWELINAFQQLLICRDAYWKIAGEEMGLGKPWSPTDSDYITGRYCIFVCEGKIICNTPAQDCILAFPTEEMRDTFYENFKELIEQCKELL